MQQHQFAHEGASWTTAGGPGFEAPRPMDEEGWMKHACAKFRVFLLDQRGTGLSDAITTSGLLRKGDAAAQAEYLSHFRRAPHLEDTPYCTFQRCILRTA